MKQIFLIVALIATLFTKNTFAQSSANQSQLPQLLSLYYNIKDALVASNAKSAASKAQAFVNATNGVSEGSLKGMAEDAGKIAKTKDLEKQREYFARLSTNIIAIAKTRKLSDDPIYQVYCPMKKASWLSSSKAIKNPYYGISMLTCGQVTETFQ